MNRTTSLPQYPTNCSLFFQYVTSYCVQSTINWSRLLFTLILPRSLPIIPHAEPNGHLSFLIFPHHKLLNPVGPALLRTHSTPLIAVAALSLILLMSCKLLNILSCQYLTQRRKGFGCFLNQ